MEFAMTANNTFMLNSLLEMHVHNINNLLDIYLYLMINATTQPLSNVVLKI